VSPSWTSRRFKRSAGLKISLGIAIGRREVCAVHVVLGEKGARVQAIHSAQLSDEMFVGKPTPASESNLVSAFAKVTAEAKGKFIPCHVALPDPAMRFSVFELDELSKSEKTRLELVRWRFAKEHPADDQVLDCACQWLGQENEKHLLLGQGIDNAWLQCVKQALRRGGVTPWSMNMGTCYRFNQFHELFVKEKHGAAMVVIDPDSWAVFLWDAAARPRLARARWRMRADNGIEDYDAIALEAERSILSYVLAGKAGSVARVYAAGHAHELEGLAAALDRRLREKCIPLAFAETDETRNIGDHALASLSYAAAVAS
jgi:hypothetical protein